MSFRSLGLPDALLSALADCGHTQPTIVQARVIPEVLAGRDVWATSSTGSGKTAAFALPLLAHYQAAEQRRSALLLVPTRELAAQVAASIDTYARRLARRPKVVVAVGGASINPQMMALRGGCDFLVATPGRLLDLAEKNAVALGQVATLVLDEADRMLDPGFADELSAVLARLPSARQTLLFSATFGPAVSKLAAGLLTSPVRVDVTERSEDPPILQRAIAVDAAKRAPLLHHLLATHGFGQALVFVATTEECDGLAKTLRGLGVAAEALHGKLSQGARTRALDGLHSGALRVLIATDLAARGLDVAGLPAVIHYDLPRSPSDYVHRNGRTGRAGQPGTSVAFVTADAHGHFAVIERRYGRIAREEVPGFEPVEAPKPARPDAAQGGIKGKRPSKKDKLRAAKAH